MNLLRQNFNQVNLWRQSISGKERTCLYPVNSSYHIRRQVVWSATSEKVENTWFLECYDDIQGVFLVNSMNDANVSKLELQWFWTWDP